MSSGPNPQLPSTFAGWAISIMIIIAIMAVLYVAQDVVGIAIPFWVATLFWICLVEFFVIAAIKFLLRFS